MRIYWQSFIDSKLGAAYLARLDAYLNEIAAPGTRVEVHGLSPPDRDFGRLAEFRCAVQAIDNAIGAEEEGYDAYVLGHFQDSGLYEIRSALRIPVIGAGEATFHAAAQLGRRLGLVTLDPVFEVWHREQADLYGLGTRLVGVIGMGSNLADFEACFAGNESIERRLLAEFTACTQPLIEAGADVIIPAGVLPGLLIGNIPGFCIGHAPVIHCAAVTLKSAEMWVQLHTLSGLEPSRGPSFALAGEGAKEDFRRSIARSQEKPS